MFENALALPELACGHDLAAVCYNVSEEFVHARFVSGTGRELCERRSVRENGSGQSVGPTRYSLRVVPIAVGKLDSLSFIGWGEIGPANAPAAGYPTLDGPIWGVSTLTTNAQSLTFTSQGLSFHD